MLVRKETMPDDIHGMDVAQGILTATGGMTSHAAVVGAAWASRPWSAPARSRSTSAAKTVGVGGADAEGRRLALVRRADRRSLVGQVPAARARSCRSSTGELKPERSDIYQRFNQLLSWADKFRGSAFAPTPISRIRRRSPTRFGARGIGLCRTEHMFFGEDRIPIVQPMILADNEKDRRAALAELLPLQREDFDGVFKAMDGIAGDDPHARSAAARVPAEARRPDGRDRTRWKRPGQATAPRHRGDGDGCCSASNSCTSSIRCSAIAASGSGSPIRRSPRCRRARSSKPPASREEGREGRARVMIPLVGDVQGAERSEGDRRSASPSEVMKEQGVKVEVPRRDDDRDAARRA